MFEKTQFSTLNDRLARVHTKALEARSNRTHCLTLARFAGKLQPILREVEIVTTISSNSSNVSAAAIVAIMNDVISRVVDLITRAGVTGKCRAIIQVESMIAEFQDITSRLAEALAAIHKFNLHLAEDINEDVEHLQSQLSRLKYRESQKVLELSNAIRKEVATRVAAGLEEAEKGNCSESSSSSISTEKHSTDGTDSLETLLRQMLIMAKLLNADGQAVGNKASAALFMELQDVRTYAESVSKGSNLEETQLWHHLEVVLERIVASQRGPIMVGPPRAAEPPEEFLCPISLEIMRDPVIMVETAMTYDRASIEQHFASGQDNCPLSGRTLVSKRMIPNYNLRSAIESWAKLHGMPWPSLDVPPRGTPRPEALPRSGSLRTGSPMAPLTGVRSMDPVEGPCDAVHLEAMSSGDTVALTMATLSSEVPVLVAELEHAAPEVAEAIVRKICELTDKNNDARVQMRQCNGIPVLVKWLSQGTPVSKGMVARALWFCARDDDNSMIIATAGAISPLVQLLWGGTDEGKEAAARAFWNLSTYNQYNKVAIAKAGAIPALVHLLCFGRPAGKEAAAGALRSLAVNDDNEMEIVRAGAIPALVGLVSNGSDNGREIALGALHNLARTDWRSEVASTGVVEVLQNLSINPNVRKEVQRQASTLLKRFSTEEAD